MSEIDARPGREKIISFRRSAAIRIAEIVVRSTELQPAESQVATMYIEGARRRVPLDALTVFTVNRVMDNDGDPTQEQIEAGLEVGDGALRLGTELSRAAALTDTPEALVTEFKVFLDTLPTTDQQPAMA